MNQPMYDPRISMHMLPLPTHAARASASTSVDEDGPKRGPPRPVNPKKKARPSAKAKANCPDELKGYNQFDDKGNPIC